MGWSLISRLVVVPPLAVMAADTTCNAGSYLRHGSVCSICEPGNYCPGGTYTFQHSCAPGTYSHFEASACTTCPAGHSCANPALLPVPCALGFYSAAGAVACIECSTAATPGAFCTPAGTLAYCSPGKQCLQTNSDSVPSCPATKYCPDASSTTALDCPAGTYAPAGSVSCTQCPLGHYCPTNGGAGGGSPVSAAVAAVACPSGQYADALGSTACTACPAGHDCQDAAAPPKACKAGTFSPAGYGICTACWAGHECTGPATEWPSVCAENTYAVAGSAQCLTCPAGYDCESRTSASACSSGYYSFTGQAVCTICPAGHQCGDQAIQPQPCGEGFYAEPGASSCTSCPAGSKCPTPYLPEPCQLGWYQSSTGQAFCLPCPAGHTCTVSGSSTGASAEPVACQAGQVTDILHQACHSCPAGYACPAPDLELVQCPEGTYSLAGEAQCQECPAGFACPSVSAAPVECAAGSYAPSGSLACLQCPVGFRCEDKKGRYQVRCLPGQYQPTHGDCQDCPAGSACPESQPGYSIKYDCPAGTYSLAKQTTCTQCPPGHKCASTTEAPVACPSGTVATGGATACQSCPANYQCPRQETLSRCPLYHYSLEGEAECSPCPAGKTCESPDLATPQDCPAGTYADTLDVSCQPCPPGHYCAGTTSSAPQVVPVSCPAGTFASSLSQASCDTCPTGFFSKGGAEVCTPIPAGFRGTGTNQNEGIEACPAGTYSNRQELDCKTCPDGFLCPAGATAATEWENSCPRGSYCVAGVQTPCPAGTYGVGERATSEATGCAACPAGYACPSGISNFELYPCPRGGYCPGGVGSSTSCAAGRYNDLLYGQSVADCKLCPAGHQCPAGSPDNGAICAEGHYCPRGSAPNQYPCPAGTYGGGQVGKRDVSECLLCPAGHYCGEATTTPTAVPAGYYSPNAGIGAIESIYLCPPKFYCPNTGQTDYRGNHCAKGHYCPAGSTSATQEPCPAGTYSDRHDLHDPRDCTPCPAGWQCAPGSYTGGSGMSACPTDAYCQEGTTTTASSSYAGQLTLNHDFIHHAQRLKLPPIPCPAGFHAPYTKSKSLEDCVPCLAGQYCTIGAYRTACPKGHYCPESTERANHYPCPAGYFNAFTSKVDIQDCLPCGVGNYCPEGSEEATPCAAGTYNSMSNTASECTACPDGFYCPTTGTVHPLACEAGCYSNSSASACSYCPAGHYCPDNSTTYATVVANVCPAGTLCAVGLLDQAQLVLPSATTLLITDYVYADGVAGAKIANNTCQSTESASLNGAAVGVSTHPDNLNHGCPKGSYCPRGTAAAIPCPAGTYNPAFARHDASDCIQVEPGHYVSGTGASAPEGLCSPGYYCPIGSTSATEIPCPSSTFRSLDGGSDGASCAPCPPGTYCDTAATVTPKSCTAGHYCPTGTLTPEPCPIGTYSTATGNEDSKQCLPAPGGRYIHTTGATNSTATACDAGFHCLGGASRPEPSDNVTGEFCPAGSACPAGAESAVPCPEGTFNPNVAGKSTAADCTTCYPGYYCEGTGNLEPDGPCPAGYYCQEGTGVPSLQAAAGQFAPLGSSTPYTCVPGFYSSTVGASVCLACSAAQSCDSPGTVDPNAQSSPVR